MTITRLTVLDCDGTYRSGEGYGIALDGKAGSFSPELSGTWKIVEDVPDSVKSEVRRFGLKSDKPYGIISYKSSIGIEGYCLFYKVERDYLLTPLYMGQISQNNYENSGALGIWEGWMSNE